MPQAKNPAAALYAAAGCGILMPDAVVGAKGGKAMACVFHMDGGTLPQSGPDAYPARAGELCGREPKDIAIRADGKYAAIAYAFGAGDQAL